MRRRPCWPAAIPAARLLPHVFDATAHARPLQAAPSAAVLLLHVVAADLQDAGQLDTARPLLDSALDIAQDDLGPDHPDTLTARGNLARFLGEAGDRKSTRLNSSHLARSRMPSTA